MRAAGAQEALMGWQAFADALEAGREEKALFRRCPCKEVLFKSNCEAA